MSMLTMIPQQKLSDALPPVARELGEQVKKGEVVVPLLPKVANRVISLTQTEDSNAAELASLIQSDQTLAGHVIRVANSAAYSPVSSIVSLQQAITRLGMATIAEIALAATVNASLFNAPGFEALIQQRLRHSLASGLWAKEVARACRRNVEAAFLGGLLQDIGRPVTIQAASEIAAKLGSFIPPEGMALLEKTFCRRMSITVVNKWEMPDSVQQVVKYFDDYQPPHSAKNQTVVAVGGVAIANYFQDNQSGSANLDTLVAHPIFGELNLYRDEIEQVVARADKVNATLEAMQL